MHHCTAECCTALCSSEFPVPFHRTPYGVPLSLFQNPLAHHYLKCLFLPQIFCSGQWEDRRFSSLQGLPCQNSSPELSAAVSADSVSIPSIAEHLPTSGIF